MPSCILCLQRILTDNPQQEEPRYATTRGHDETPTDDHKLVLTPTEEAQKGGIRKPKKKEAGRHAVQRQHYAELDFSDKRPIPPPPSDMFVVAYAEVGQA